MIQIIRANKEEHVQPTGELFWECLQWANAKVRKEFRISFEIAAILEDDMNYTKDARGKNRLDDPADFVRIEIQSALDRNIPVIPLLVRDARMPREEDLPPKLRKLIYRNGTLIRSDPDFHRDMDRLIAALNRYMR